jgi:hypothetical protein
MRVLFITTAVRISNPARMSLVGFEVPTAVSGKMFWVLSPYSLVPMTRRYNPEDSTLQEKTSVSFAEPRGNTSLSKTTK